ncbi:MAG TPA: DNA methyltransferase, partial [Myxococcaceae bacterium]
MPSTARAARSPPPSSPFPERSAWAAGPGWALHAGDCLERLAALPAESVDLAFADPPYFLSNGGFTCQSGRRAPVGKGAWDASRGIDEDHRFTRAWIEACGRVLRPTGSL